MARKSVDPDQYTYDVIFHPTLRDLAASRQTLNENAPERVTFTLFNRFRLEQINLAGVVTEITYSGNYAQVNLLDGESDIWEINFQFQGYYQGTGTAFHPAGMIAAHQA